MSIFVLVDNDEDKRKAYLPKSIKRHLNWLVSLPKGTALS